MNPKFFNVEEADRLIGFLEATFDRIQRNRQLFLWLKEEIAVLGLIVDCGASSSNPDALSLTKKAEKQKQIGGDIEKDVASVLGTGCIIRDVDKGLVDFYSIKKENVIFLCWRKGEDSVKYWHSLHEGFEGRQPLIRSTSS